MKKLIFAILFLFMLPLYAAPAFKDFHRDYLISTAKQMIDSRHTDYKKAEATFAELAKTASLPDEKAKWIAWQAIAIGYQDGRRDEAMKLAESAGKIPDAKYAQIKIMAHHKEWRELAEKFKKEDLSIWRDEIRIPALTLRATALSVSGDYESAIIDYEAYLKEQETTSWGWIQAAGSIASCYARGNDDEKALKAYQRIFDMAEQVEDGWVGSSYHSSAMQNASKILRSQGKIEEAFSVMSKGEIISPSTIGSVIETKGDILVEMKKTAEAIVMYKEAIEANNKSGKRYQRRNPSIEKKIEALSQIPEDAPVNKQ